MRPTLLMGLVEGLGMRYLKLASQMQICPKTNLSLIVVVDFAQTSVFFFSEYGEGN